MRTPCHIHTSPHSIRFDHTYVYYIAIWFEDRLSWCGKMNSKYKEKQHLDLLCGNIKLDP